MVDEAAVPRGTCEYHVGEANAPDEPTKAPVEYVLDSTQRLSIKVGIDDEDHQRDATNRQQPERNVKPLGQLAHVVLTPKKERIADNDATNEGRYSTPRLHIDLVKVDLKELISFFFY